MVTDTAMARKGDQIYAFGPVVRELDVFQSLFGQIVWIGFDRPDMADDPVMLPVPEALRCILLPRSGGDSAAAKLGVLLRAPQMLQPILREVARADVIHTRAPSSPAFLALLSSFFFKKNKIWWHKYAGNWGQKNLPRFFGIQRYWLRKARHCRVTINGRWPDQPAHCLSFENPCLSGEERERGMGVIRSKSYEERLDLCFVGRLDATKGIPELIAAFDRLGDPTRIARLHVVGDGPLRAVLTSAARSWPFETRIYGSQSRSEVGRIMSECHLQLLPSRAEGFPKVIAEGANYGCVPVVSDISGIAQYVQDGVNSFLMRPERLDAGLLHEDLAYILAQANLREMALSAWEMAEAFTFVRYGERIRREILSHADPLVS